MLRSQRSRLSRATTRRLLTIGAVAGMGLLLASCGSSASKTSTTTHGVAPVIIEHFTKLPCNHKNTLGLEGCAEGQLLSTDKRIDKEVTLLFSLVPKAQQKSLAAAETVFLKYRSATCKAYSDVYRGGSFAPVEYAQCEVRMDEVQSTALHGYFRLAEADASHSLAWP
jgi:uncharacterized protein YecT (DUF1311 family)